MTDISEDFMTVKDVEFALDVSNACLHAWRAIPDSGPPWEKIGARYLYPRDKFREYLTALTGGALVPRGLSHKAKLELFGRLHDPAPTNRDLATRLRAVEQALLAMTQIFSIKQESAEPTKIRRKYKKRKTAKGKAVGWKIAKRNATVRNAAKRKTTNPRSSERRIAEPARDVFPF